jgi:hypothetical protein
MKTLEPRAGKEIRCPLGFGLAHTEGTEDYPIKPALRVLLFQAEDRSTASNFNVVGVGSQTENGKGAGPASIQIQGDHAGREWARSMK